MYKLKKVCSDEEKALVVNTMGKTASIDADHVWGFWEGSKCIGGITLYNTGNVATNENFTIEITVPPSYSLGLLGYSALTEALKVSKRLLAKISIGNVVSIKGAKQLGFKPVYKKNENVYMELTEINPAMHKRWKDYV